MTKCGKCYNKKMVDIWVEIDKDGKRKNLGFYVGCESELLTVNETRDGVVDYPSVCEGYVKMGQATLDGS